MSSLALARNVWKRGDGPDVPCLNLIFEQDPRNLKDQVSLLQRPGLRLFAACGAGPIRGIFRHEGVLGGAFIVVSGTSLYKVSILGAVTQIAGVISGTDRVSIAGNGAKAYIANGTGLYSTNGTALTTETFPDGAGVSSVAYINGYLLFVRTDTQRFYWLLPGSTVIDALDYASAENKSDNLLAILNFSDELWMFGASTIEVWDPTGDAEFPFLRTGGKLFDLSCANAATIASAGQALFWVGSDISGGLLVFQGGDVPVRVSDHSVEEALRKADVADLRAWACGVDGHTLYCLSTGSATFALDLESKTWTNFASFGMDEWRAHLGASMADGSVVGADSVDGRLWLLDPELNTDGTDPMIREFASRTLVKTPTNCARVALSCTLGNAAIGLDPMVALSYSDDGGEEWSPWFLESLGRTGERQVPATWTQLGIMDGDARDFRWRITDDVKVTVRSAELN